MQKRAAPKEKFYPRPVFRDLANANAGGEGNPDAAREPFMAEGRAAHAQPHSKEHELKESIRHAREIKDVYMEGCSLFRLAEVKLKKEERGRSKQGAAKASSSASINRAGKYAFMGAKVLLTAGHINEAIKATRVLLRSKIAAGSTAPPNSSAGKGPMPYHLHYQAVNLFETNNWDDVVNCCNSGLGIAERASTSETRVQELSILDEMQKSCWKRTTCKYSLLLFHDSVKMTGFYDLKYLRRLEQEEQLACKSHTVAQSLFDTSSREAATVSIPRRRYLNSLLWHCEVLLKMGRTLASVSPRERSLELLERAKEVLNQVNQELDQEKSEGVCDDLHYKVRCLCIESEILLLSNDPESSLVKASSAFDLSLKESKTSEHGAGLLVCSCIAKARILIYQNQHHPAQRVLQALLSSDGFQGQESTAVHKEMERCLKRLQLIVQTRMKVSALKRQLDTLTEYESEGMKAERTAHLTQILAKQKEIGDWSGVLLHSKILVDLTALGSEPWRHMIDYAEAHFRLGSYSQAAVSCNEAFITADESASAGVSDASHLNDRYKCRSQQLGRCNALFYRALSRLAIGERILAEKDLAQCCKLAESSEEEKGNRMGDNHRSLGLEAEIKLIYKQCMKLLSMLYWVGFEGKENDAKNCQKLADIYENAPSHSASFETNNANSAMSIREQQHQMISSPSCRTSVDFGLTSIGAMNANEDVVKLYHSVCARLCQNPSSRIEQSLHRIGLAKNGSLRFSLSLDTSTNALSGSIKPVTDSDLKPLIQTIFNTDMYSHFAFDGVVLDFAHNSLSNHSVRELCSRMNECDTNKVRVVGLDLSHNNLSAGSLTDLVRCDKVLQSIEALNLRGNRRLLASRGEIVALQELLGNAPIRHLDVVGTSLRKDGYETLLANLPSAQNVEKLSIGLLHEMTLEMAESLADIVASLRSLRYLEVVGLPQESTGTMYDAFVSSNPNSEMYNIYGGNCTSEKMTHLHMLRISHKHYNLDGFQLSQNALVAVSRGGAQSSTHYSNIPISSNKPAPASLFYDHSHKRKQTVHSDICVGVPSLPEQKMKRSKKKAESRKRSCYGFVADEDEDGDDLLHESGDDEFMRDDLSELSSHSRSSLERTRVKRKLQQPSSTHQGVNNLHEYNPTSAQQRTSLQGNERSTVSRKTADRPGRIRKNRPLATPSNGCDSRDPIMKHEYIPALPLLSSEEESGDEGGQEEESSMLSLSESSDFMRSDNSALSEHSDTSQERTRIKKLAILPTTIDVDATDVNSGAGRAVKRSMDAQINGSMEWRSALQKLVQGRTQKQASPSSLPCNQKSVENRDELKVAVSVSSDDFEGSSIEDSASSCSSDRPKYQTQRCKTTFD